MPAPEAPPETILLQSHLICNLTWFETDVPQSEALPEIEVQPLFSFVSSDRSSLRQ